MPDAESGRFSVYIQCYDEVSAHPSKWTITCEFSRDGSPISITDET